MTDPETKPILAGTKWCINAASNMIALPLFGHTVKWYADQGDMLVPPPFINRPQHDWDHNCKAGYTEEVTTRLRSYAKDLKEAKEAHKLPPPENIAGSLTSLSGQFRTILTTRGVRSGGTHVVIQGGAKMTGWYFPFSMANDAVATKRRAPMSFDKAYRAKLKALMSLISGG